MCSSNFKTKDYNLLYEDWIPVLYHDGNWERVSIIKAFEDASKIRQIAASNPMDRFAIFRFLLALVYWSRGNPPENPGEEIFTADMRQKLEDNQDCFNLLGDGKRFYQVEGNNRIRPSTDLIHEIPTANNFWHFKHVTDYEEGLCLSCCIMGLLRLPLFTTLGGSGGKITAFFFPGINGAPPIYIYRLGNNLNETLIFNWNKSELIGCPNWEHHSIPQSDHDFPMLNGLTHLPRKIWLGSIEKGICTLCGDSSGIIRTCNIESPGKSKDELWIDPNVIYSWDEDKRKSMIAPLLDSTGDFRTDHPWIKLLTRLLENTVPSEDMTVKSYLAIAPGFGFKDPKRTDVWEFTFPLNKVKAKDEIIQRLDILRKKYWQLDRRISRSEDERIALTAFITPHIDTFIRKLVIDSSEEDLLDWQNAAEEYRPMMKVIAKSLSPGFTTSAVERRNRIANTIPDMNIKDVSVKKSEDKKGEEEWKPQELTLGL